MKLSQVQTAVRTATIDLGNGQSLEIKFRSLSPVEWERVEAESKKQRWGLVVELAAVLVETGLEDNDGNPIEPTVENLRMVDLPILKAMMATIWNVTLPKKES